MTAELEQDMDHIAAGQTSKDEVLRISREMLHSTTTDVQGKREDLAKVIWAGMDEDRILGPCKVCEEAGRTQEDGSPNMLRVIRARKSGKRFVGCQGWDPEDGADSCDQTFPLPQRGDVHRLEERCSICGQTPRLKVTPPRGRAWDLCLNDDCPSMQEMKRRRAERQAAQAEREAAAKADGSDGSGAPARRSGNGAKRRRKPSPSTARTRRAGSGSRTKS
jgi:DNA topoisomerase-1